MLEPPARASEEADVAERNAKLALDASRLADASRQNILAAHELAAKEAQARGGMTAEDKAFWAAMSPPTKGAGE